MFLKKQWVATLLVVVCLLGGGSVSYAFSHGKRVHLRGHLIDMSCWNDHDGKDDQKMLREHTKNCLQMPDCIKSGYAIVTADGKVYPMDAASNASTTQWIAATQRDDNWLVEVKGHWLDGKLDVKKIQLSH